ncbi:MAG: ABC transporter permease, partial [Anaerolineae bacterium]
MRKVGLVIKQEVLSTIKQRSFWVTSFVFPLIVFMITFGSQFVSAGLSDDEAGNGTPSAPGMPTASQEREPAGYVDRAQVIERIPDGFPEDVLLPYPNESAARAAVQAGEIGQYYIVPEDFYETGKVVLVQGEFAPLQEFGGVPPFEYLVTYNLTEDADVAALILSPAPRTETVSLAGDPSAENGQDDSARGLGTTIVPTAMLFIFFFVLTMSSGYMLRSVTKEKETNVMEVLLLSLRPRELMAGKILGLGVVALLQMTIWLGGALLVLGEGLPMIGLLASAAALDLPPQMILWFVLYFLF